MPSSVNYYYIKVNAKAIIDGTEYSLSNLELNYELDEIATATISLPIGRQISSQAIGRISSAMNIFSNTQPFTPVQVMMKLEIPLQRAAPLGKNIGFPVGWFLAFDGYFSAPAHRKTSSGTASLVIQCFGKTAALSGATQYTNGTAISIDSANGGSYAVVHVGDDNYNKTMYDAINELSSNIAEDVWTSGIKILSTELLRKVNSWSNAVNPQLATAALARINMLVSNLPASRLTLNRNATTQFQTEFNKSLAKQLCDGFYQIWRNGDDEADLWDVIRAFGQHFRYHFVPTVSEDCIAPICPNLNGEPLLTIDPSEYDQIDLSAVYSPKFYAYIKTVGLYTKAFSASPYQATSATARAIGRASLKNENFIGRVKMFEAPCWTIPPGAPANKSLTPGGQTADKSNPKPDALAPGLDQGTMEKLWFSSGVGNDLARTILHEEVWRHRKIHLSGRARFDICPGSTVRLNTAGENFTSEQATFYGLVDRVSIRVTDGASGNSISTVIKLANVRTETENKNYGVSEHPLFKQRWIGGVLAEGSDRVK